MKKWLLNIGVFTIIIVITGILFVYGIFDIKGTGALTSLRSSANLVLELHNTIVEHVHEIGNLAKESHNELNKDEINIDSLKAKILSISLIKHQLTALIDTSDFNHRKKAIKDDFRNRYLPALEQWEEAFTEVILYNNQTSISDAQITFFDSHNYYREILNENRRY